VTGLLTPVVLLHSACARGTSVVAIAQHTSTTACPLRLRHALLGIAPRICIGPYPIDTS